MKQLSIETFIAIAEVYGGLNKAGIESVRDGDKNILILLHQNLAHALLDGEVDKKDIESVSTIVLGIFSGVNFPL